MADVSQLVGCMAGERGMSVGQRGIRFVDSHTAGEPTRVIIDGGPDVGSGAMHERLVRLRDTADHFRRSVINEPRGWDAIVGALLCEPSDSSCATAAIFFNNTGYLGMCGHGAIGVAVTLHYLGRIGLGKQQLETPVGVVEVNLLSPHEVAIENVPSFRLHSKVDVHVDGLGTFTGDVAWGGNWFFLVDKSPAPLTLENVDALSDIASRIRQALNRGGITGANGAEIDHIEFLGPPVSPDAHSRNFVYCPGGAYDRSPCGTGTSAKLACLAADGKLQPGESWIQESIIGSRFKATYRLEVEPNALASGHRAEKVGEERPAASAVGSHTEGGANQIIPEITGHAYVCGEGVLIQQPDDPFKHGIGGSAT